MTLMLTGVELNTAYIDPRRRSGKVQSNVVARPEPGKKYETIESEKSLCFIDVDHGVNRFYFYTSDFEDLGRIVGQINKSLVADVITKNRGEYSDELNRMGFTSLATMRRLVNKDITELVERLKPPEIPVGG